MPDDFIRQMNKLPGVRASKTCHHEIHINFNKSYKKTTCCEYFVKIEHLQDGTWDVFSHSLPHYLPIKVILRNAPYEDPMKIVEDVDGFLESLAKRKGQVLETKARYPTLLKITNTATYDLVRVFFKQETEMDLLRGSWFDLKYTLLGELPARVNATIPERISRNMTRQNHKDLQEIIKGFKKRSIASVIKSILLD